MKKQLFISHTWVLDEQGRDTHKRARDLMIELNQLGWTTWLDEFDMENNIDSSMANGIDNSEVVLILMTRAYARKVNRGAQGQKSSNDNCLKEFGYALFRQKVVVPVIFEDSMLDPSSWSPGVVPMRLSMTMYIDGSGSPTAAAQSIDKMLKRQGYVPHRQQIRRSMMRQKSRNTPFYTIYL